MTSRSVHFYTFFTLFCCCASTVNNVNCADKNQLTHILDPRCCDHMRNDVRNVPKCLLFMIDDSSWKCNDTNLNPYQASSRLHCYKMLSNDDFSFPPVRSVSTADQKKSIEFYIHTIDYAFRVPKSVSTNFDVEQKMFAGKLNVCKQLSMIGSQVFYKAAVDKGVRKEYLQVLIKRYKECWDISEYRSDRKIATPTDDMVAKCDKDKGNMNDLKRGNAVLTVECREVEMELMKDKQRVEKELEKCDVKNPQKKMTGMCSTLHKWKSRDPKWVYGYHFCGCFDREDAPFINLKDSEDPPDEDPTPSTTISTTEATTSSSSTTQRYGITTGGYGSTTEEYGSTTEEYGSTTEEYGSTTEEYGNTTEEYGSVTEEYGGTTISVGSGGDFSGRSDSRFILMAAIGLILIPLVITVTIAIHLHGR